MSAALHRYVNPATVRLGDSENQTHYTASDGRNAKGAIVEVQEFKRFEPPVCQNCKAYAPDVMVPWDDGAIPMCWLCAHMLTVHEVEPGTPLQECTCGAEAVFPPDVLLRRKSLLAEGTGVFHQPAPVVVVNAPAAPVAVKASRDYPNDSHQRQRTARAARVENIRKRQP